MRQEYFFTSASIQDIIRRHVEYMGDVRTLPDKAAIQLNDTHPAVAVAEIMRILVDLHGLEFGEAWEITKKTVGYTNHTLLPEALESWPLAAVRAAAAPPHADRLCDQQPGAARGAQGRARPTAPSPISR